MRDIRSDLEDRAQLLREQLKASQSAFERQVETIEREYENKLEELRAVLDAVNALLGSENCRLNSAKEPDAESKSEERKLQQVRPRHADLKKQLTDFIIRELCQTGPASKDDLLKLAERHGYFADVDSAESTLKETLTQSKKTGSIRQLPNGNFTLPTIAETIKLRRAG